jgi:hypothetical protein
MTSITEKFDDAHQKKAGNSFVLICIPGRFSYFSCQETTRLLQAAPARLLK